MTNEDYKMMHISEYGTVQDRISLLSRFPNLANNGNKSAKCVFDGLLEQSNSHLSHFGCSNHGFLFKTLEHSIVDTFITEPEEMRSLIEQMTGIEMKPYIHPTTGDISHEFKDGKYNYIIR